MIESGTDEFSAPPQIETGIAHGQLPYLEGELRRPEISFFYRFSLVIVSLAMILLPLAYLGIVGLFGCGICYYATHFTSVLEWHTYGPRGALFKLLVYLGPIFIGLVLVFFLIKPLFAPRREKEEPFSLNHADAPQLFALIGWICRSLEAPIPSRIDVDLSVNAGAGFRGGVKSMFGNDVVLVIGLPLAAGLNLSQFAGVIAHEFGHFSQGAGMRAGYLIRLISAWFFRVVYERDKWDYALVAASEHPDQGVLGMLFFHFARLGVWFGRGVLWVLMMIGHTLSSFLARQMEFDADGYEINLAGSASFVESTQRMQQLNLGAVVAEKQLIQKWKGEKKLFDQLPDFIVSRANEIPAEIQGKVHSANARRKTHLFDSHPSDVERIQRAEAANEPGILHSTVPATSLFTNFSDLARRATVLHYQDLIGPDFNWEMLISTEQIVRQSDHDSTADLQNVDRYFLGVHTGLRPVIIAETKAISIRRIEDTIAAVQFNREQMRQLFPAAQLACAQLAGADGRYLQTVQAAYLLQAGFSFDPADFNVTENDFERAQTDAAQAVRFAGAELFPFVEAGRVRMTDTLQLLRLSQATTVVPEARRLQDEVKELVFVLSRLGAVFEPLQEIRKDCAALGVLLQYHRSGAAAENLSAALENLCAGIQERINFVQEQTGKIRYPFSHAGGQIFVSQYARNTEYHADPCELTLREGVSHVEKIVSLYYRLLGNLVLICEEVERHAVP